MLGETGYLSAADFENALKLRGLNILKDQFETAQNALLRFEWLKSELGLDHFEGRTWHGWHHHVSLVFAAYHFLAAQGRSAELPPFRSPQR